MMIKPIITIPNAAFLDGLPPHRARFYYLLLGAIIDKATEVRIESGEGFGKVWMTISGKPYQMVPMPKEEVEKEILALVHSMDGRPKLDKQDTEEVRFCVNVSGKTTEVTASISPEALVLNFHDPEKAASEAKQIADEISRRSC